jgi:hypothetical protein
MDAIHTQSMLMLQKKKEKKIEINKIWSIMLPAEVEENKNEQLNLINFLVIFDK